jgi:hypothetical protein
MRFHHGVHLGRRKVFEARPAQVFKGAAPGVNALRVDAARHGRAQAYGFVFFQGVQVVQAAQKQQVSDLLHHLQGVGDAAGPERVPDSVNLAAQFAREHEDCPPVVVELFLHE